MSVDSESIDKKQEQPILTLIQQIKDGRLDPKIIAKDLRQQCVEVFLGEGYSVSSMAQILRKCEKTIRRDIEDIRERNALTPDIDLAKRLVGELLSYARIHRGYLMRMARSQDASVGERSQAEYYAFRVEMELISKLQTLGYLPLKPQEIVADFSHHVTGDDEKSFGELRNQIAEIEKIEKLSPEMLKELAVLKKRIEKAEIGNKVAKISIGQKKG